MTDTSKPKSGAQSFQPNPAGPYVLDVETNVKGPRRAYDLSPLTLIVGPSGSGKSAICQAIELALTSRASRKQGGWYTKEVELMSLHPEGQGDLVANVRLSSGSSRGVAISGSTAKAKRPVVIGAATVGELDAIFPLSQIEEALTGNVDTQRKALLRILQAMPVDLDDVESKVDLDALARAVDGAAAGLAQARAAARDAVVVLEAIQNEKSPEPAVEVDEPSAVVEDEQPAVWAVDTAMAMFRAATAAVKAIEADQGTDSNVKENPAASLVMCLDLHLSKGAKKCGICGGALDLDAAAIRRAKLHAADVARVEANRAIGEAWSKKLHAARGAEQVARTDANIAQQNLSNLRARNAAARARAEGMKAGRKAAVADDRDARLADASADVQATAGAAASAEAAAAQAKKALEKGLTSAAARLEKAITRYFQPIVLRLVDGERQVCQIGLPGLDGKDAAFVRTDLSGAEWTRFLAAFSAVAVKPAGYAGPRILIVPDRQFDPQTLSKFMISMRRAVEDGGLTQVIIQSVVEPATDVAGWSIISLAEV